MALQEGESRQFYGICVKDSVTKTAIVGASVTFFVGGETIYETTDNSGFACCMTSHIQNAVNGNVAPVDYIDYEDCLCDISANGYEFVGGIVIEYDPDIITRNSAKVKAISNPVYLTPLQNEYYYSIKVIDKTTDKVVPNATVEVYTLPGSTTPTTTGTTNNKGTYFYSNTSGGTVYFTIKCNGYKTVSQYSIAGTLTLPESPTEIKIEPTTQAKYYYVVSVKDEAGKPAVVENNGVKEYAKVRLFTDFTESTPYSVLMVITDDADDEILCILRDIISSKLNIDASNIWYDDNFIRDIGVDSLDSVEIMLEVEDKFNVTAPSDMSIFETVNDLVQYIKENTTIRSFPQTVYSVNDDGLVQVEIPRTINVTSVPSDIFAKGFSLPINPETGRPKYTWGTTNSGSVSATLSPTTPGLSLTVKAYGNETFYYNIRVVDEQTQQPISGAEVVFTDGDENVLATKTSGNDGIVKYSNKSSRVYVAITRTSYTNFNRISYPGSTSNTYVYDIYLSQKRTIQVVDKERQPVQGVIIKIYYYDDRGKEVSLGTRYRTYATGYIDVLDDSVYVTTLTTDVYVEVINYQTDEPDKLKKKISGTNIIIELPEKSESDEEYYDFEEFNEFSVNSIKNFISSGNKEVTDNGESDKVTYNSDDFRINIIDPDSISTYDIFTCIPVVVNNNNKSVIGSVDINMKRDLNDIRIKVLNRYSGYYNPIFKDILFYKNFQAVDDDYNKTNCPYSNTEFDPEYKDNYGKFGVIDNMWFHKVNDNSDTKIITSLNPRYPLTGQYAIDYRDYNIFETNWDMYHYTKQLSVDNSEGCQSVMSMKEGLNLFGSKYLNVPNSIEICGFSLGDEFNEAFLVNANNDDMSWKNDLSWSGDWNDDWITNPNGCPGEVMFKEVNNNSVDFYFFIKKRILRYFREMLRVEFNKYISGEYTFGKPGIDDDIDEYVTKNVLKLYKLEKVRVFVKRTKRGQHNSKIENDYTKYLQYIPDPKTGELVELEKDNLGYFRSHGFVEINNVTMTKMNRDDFDRKLVYNLRSGVEEKFGFSFILRKI